MLHLHLPSFAVKDNKFSAFRLTMPDQNKAIVLKWQAAKSANFFLQQNICTTCTHAVQVQFTTTFFTYSFCCHCRHQGGCRQLSVGTTSVWGVNWDGRVVARVGISEDSPTGREWATVDSEPLIHVLYTRFLP